MNRRAIEVREKALGQEHLSTLTSVSNLAGILECLGRRDEAIMLYQRALTGFGVALGQQHPQTHACQQQYEAAKG